MIPGGYQMGRMGLVRRIWLTRLSKPAADRVVYRHLLKHAPSRIMQIGLGPLDRTSRMLSVARAAAEGRPIHYVGLDRFEERLPMEPAGPSLKQAHQRLTGLGRVQLVPGNADSSLARLCNHLGVFDLVLIAADTDPRHLERCWFFIQRITKPASTVLLESVADPQSGPSWRAVPKATLDDLASRTVLRRVG